MEAIAAVTHSALALDILVWLSRRLHTLGKPVKVLFVSFNKQVGQEDNDRKTFKKNFDCTR